MRWSIPALSLMFVGGVMVGIAANTRSARPVARGIQAMADIREHHRKQAARQQRGSVRHKKADLKKAPHNPFTGIVCAPSSIREHALHADEYD
jgi:hypothetical protein